MLRIVNTWTASPVVSPEEIESLSHPYGEQHVVQRPEEAAKIYPEQTKTLNETLNQWRKKLETAPPNGSTKNMKRPTLIWFTFFLFLALGLSAMAWMTRTVMRLDQAQARQPPLPSSKKISASPSGEWITRSPPC